MAATWRSAAIRSCRRHAPLTSTTIKTTTDWVELLPYRPNGLRHLTGRGEGNEVMDVRVNTDRTIGDLIELRNRNFLQVDHEYQRGLRWTDIQNRMFIDSIFRSYSIPAFYLHKKQTVAAGDTNTFYYIVDGQQRIEAIHSYSEGAFQLLDPSDESEFRFPNFVKDDPCPWAGKRYGGLSQDIQDQLLTHKIVVYEISTENENKIRDLFIRLQGGTPLTPQDKRDSWPGNFTEFVLRMGGKTGVDKWYGHQLFKQTSKHSNESRRRQLVAQLFMLFWTVRKEAKFCDIKTANIDEFYHSQVGFDDESNEAREFKRICDKLHTALLGKPRVVGHYLIHLFLLMDSLSKEYVDGSWEPRLAGSLHEFEKRRREAADADKKQRITGYDKYHTEYGRLAQTGSDNAATIRRRHAFFSEEMLKLLKPKKLDLKRSFSELERRTVFFRDLELCQWCRMNGDTHKVPWEECELHHVLPHTEGGETSISNAVLVHRQCHPKDDNNVSAFLEWWKGDGLAQNVESSPKNSFPPPEGTKASFKYKGSMYVGLIQNGKLVVAGDGQRDYGSFSKASDAITKTSRNGWRDWELLLPGKSEWVLADDWRSVGSG